MISALVGRAASRREVARCDAPKFTWGAVFVDPRAAATKSRAVTGSGRVACSLNLSQVPRNVPSPTRRAERAALKVLPARQGPLSEELPHAGVTEPARPFASAASPWDEGPVVSLRFPSGALLGENRTTSMKLRVDPRPARSARARRAAEISFFLGEERHDLAKTASLEARREGAKLLPRECRAPAPPWPRGVPARRASVRLVAQTLVRARRA